MNTRQNRRGQFRRYIDRRVAALLELHEILFYDEPGVQRDLHFLDTVNEDYQTDRVAIVQLVESQKDTVKILSASSNWESGAAGRFLSGSGIGKIVQTQFEFAGALTLSKFRSSSLFEPDEWQNLWKRELIAPASALLSVPIAPKDMAPAFMWLVVNSGSREWSSHDRDLSEEEAVFLARVLTTRALGAAHLPSYE